MPAHREKCITNAGLDVVDDDRLFRCLHVRFAGGQGVILQALDHGGDLGVQVGDAPLSARFLATRRLFRATRLP